MAEGVTALPDYLLEPNAVLLDDVPWRHGQVCALPIQQRVRCKNSQLQRSTTSSRTVDLKLTCRLTCNPVPSIRTLEHVCIPGFCVPRYQTMPRLMKTGHKVSAASNLQHLLYNLASQDRSYRTDSRSSCWVSWGDCDQPCEGEQMITALQLVSHLNVTTTATTA